jgi:hypothetical protein
VYLCLFCLDILYLLQKCMSQNCTHRGPRAGLDTKYLYITLNYFKIYLLIVIGTGFQTHAGFRVRVPRVRVQVQDLRPTKNPYPQRVSRVSPRVYLVSGPVLRTAGTSPLFCFLSFYASFPFSFLSLCHQYYFTHT